ncbi:MAG: hypothetical protein JO063_02210, partial [Pseudonocardiales bacterium]|nr:hypothetical protein [Pseudonocardiales bacterium]
MAPTAFVATLALVAGVAGAAVVGTASTPSHGTLLGGLMLAATFGIARLLAIE